MVLTFEVGDGLHSFIRVLTLKLSDSLIFMGSFDFEGAIVDLYQETCCCISYCRSFAIKLVVRENNRTTKLKLKGNIFSLVAVIELLRRNCEIYCYVCGCWGVERH